jgi:hypothetical protein
MNSLVNYSSSESESEDEVPLKPQEITVKSKTTNKLPMLLSIDKKTNCDKDNPEDHQMRQRSIPHVEGNWATHVFIDCE